MGPKTFAGTDYLFARPSFLSGFARALDLGGTFDEYNRSESDAEADFRAIESDWKAIGFDLQRVFDENK